MASQGPPENQAMDKTAVPGKQVTSEPTLAFIGAGNMAGSLIGGWFGKVDAASADGNSSEQHKVRVADTSETQLEKLQSRFSQHPISTTRSSQQAVTGADLVIIAVKPNIVEAVCREIADAISPSTTVLSVAAGVRLADMQIWLQPAAGGTFEGPLVRCMPNTPALLGAGVTGMYANEMCNATERQRAEMVMTAAGQVVWVNQETLLDAVTAVSGSGPAYFFHLIECMAEAGEALGLDPEDASNLAIETAYGAALMARQKEHPPAQLRENVTSKGGTTAAALASFQNDGFADIIERGMNAARDRATELADEFGSG